MTGPASWSRIACAVAACVMLNTHASASAEPRRTAARSARANPEPLQQARAHFKLGVAYFKERNYRGAEIEFRTAYELWPNYKLLYNVAQACVELQEYANAIQYFERYLHDSGTELSPARHDEVQAMIRALQARIANLTVTSNEAGAEIYVDDSRVGTAPLSGALRVSAGRHKLSAQKPGLARVEAIVDVSAGEQRAVRLDFAPPPELVAAPTPRATEDGPRWPSEVLWTGAAAGALLVGAATLSILTLDAEQQYNATRRTLSSEERLSELRSDAQTKARITDVLWGATLVTAAVSVYLYVREQDTESEPAVGVSVTPHAAGVTVRSRF